MAIISTIPGGVWFGKIPNFSSSSPAFAFTAMSGATYKYALIFLAPKTGTLQRVAFRTGSVTTDPINGVRISFQGFNTSGQPDGIVSHYRTLVGLTANSWHLSGIITDDGTDTGNRKVVTAGDIVVVVIDMPSFTTGDNFQLVSSAVTPVMTGNWLYRAYYTASWTLSNTAIPTIAIKYDDEEFAHITPDVFSILNYLSTQYDMNDIPDEYALRFSVPYNVQIDAMHFLFSPQGVGYTIKIYDAADNVLRTISPSFDATSSTFDLGSFFVFEPVDIIANRVYRIGIAAGHVSSMIRLYRIEVPNVSYWKAIAGGPEWYESTRTDGGAWTDDLLKRPMAQLRVYGADNNAFRGGEVSGAYSG